MKGLLYKLIPLIFIFSGVMYGGNLRIEFHNTPYPQSDRELGIMQKFLLFSADNRISDSFCFFTYDLDGQLVLSGPEEILHTYVSSFGDALDQTLQEGILSGQFEELKSCFLETIDGEEKALALGIEWERVNAIRPSLNSITQMILCNLPDEFHMNAMTSTSESNTELFYQLRLTEEDQSNICTIIRNLGELGWLGLLRKKSAMEKLGDKLAPVHPLRFLGYILNRPSLKKQLPKIMGDFVKKKSFFNGHGKRTGFAQRMSNEMSNGNMMQYVPGFAQSIGVSEQSITHYFNSHDWEGLIRFLM